VYVIRKAQKAKLVARLRKKHILWSALNTAVNMTITVSCTGQLYASEAWNAPARFTKASSLPHVLPAYDSWVVAMNPKLTQPIFALPCCWAEVASSTRRSFGICQSVNTKLTNATFNP